VSGAPKIQAINTITACESSPRGVYAGLVGYIDHVGNFDSCIAIRTAVQRGNVVTLQAGAGIVYDSVPEKEYEETEHKMRVFLSLYGIHGEKEEL
jgi:anthranilate synthase component 1